MAARPPPGNEAGRGTGTELASLPRARRARRSVRRLRSRCPMAKGRKQPDDTPRPRVTAAERRRQILAAARTLFRTRGYAATTPEAVAEAAGVKLASVQKHFPAKA